MTERDSIVQRAESLHVDHKIPEGASGLSIIQLLGIPMVVAVLSPLVAAGYNWALNRIDHDPSKRLDERERQFSYAHEAMEWILNGLATNHEAMCDLGARILLMPAAVFRAAVEWAQTDILLLAQHFRFVPIWQIANRFADLFPGYVVTLYEDGSVVEQLVSAGLEVPRELKRAERRALKQARSDDVAMAPIVLGHVSSRAFKVSGYKRRVVVLSEVRECAQLKLNFNATGGVTRTVLDVDGPTMAIAGDGTLVPAFLGEPLQRFGTGVAGETIYVADAAELQAARDWIAAAEAAELPLVAAVGAEPSGGRSASTRAPALGIGFDGWPAAANETSGCLGDSRDSLREEALPVRGERDGPRSRRTGLPGRIDDPGVVYDDQVAAASASLRQAAGRAANEPQIAPPRTTHLLIRGRARSGSLPRALSPGQILDLAHTYHRAREEREAERRGGRTHRVDDPSIIYDDEVPAAGRSGSRGNLAHDSEVGTRAVRANRVRDPSIVYDDEVA